MDYRLTNNPEQFPVNTVENIYEFKSNGRAFIARRDGKPMPLCNILNLLKRTKHWTVGQLMEEAKKELRDTTHFYLVQIAHPTRPIKRN